MKSLFDKVFKTRKVPRRCPQVRSARLGVEMLETRVMPVVGASVLAPVIGPGTNLDGVVSLENAVGLGSGSELDDQRMILTAAHATTKGGLSNLTVALAAVPGSGGAGYTVGQTFTMPAVFLGAANGLLDTGAQPLTISIVGPLGLGGSITNAKKQRGQLSF